MYIAPWCQQAEWPELFFYQNAKTSQKDNRQTQAYLLLGISKGNQWRESNPQFICFQNRKLKSHTSTYSRQQNKTANRRSAHHPACLPHSGPECQKAVQWGVLQQRSLYGNDPADTVLCKHRAGGDETLQPEPWRLLRLVLPPLPELLQMCKILALATKTPTPIQTF